MSRMTKEDWEFLHVLTANYLPFLFQRVGFPLCRICSTLVPYKPVQFLWRGAGPLLPIGVMSAGRAGRALSRHMKRHVERFSPAKRRQFMASMALGAFHSDACREILEMPVGKSFVDFFRSTSPNTQGVPDAPNEHETAQSNEEGRLHSPGPGG